MTRDQRKRRKTSPQSVQSNSLTSRERERERERFLCTLFLSLFHLSSTVQRATLSIVFICSSVHFKLNGEQSSATSLKLSMNFAFYSFHWRRVIDQSISNGNITSLLPFILSYSGEPFRPLVIHFHSNVDERSFQINSQRFLCHTHLQKRQQKDTDSEILYFHRFSLPFYFTFLPLSTNSKFHFLQHS